MLAYRHAFHAGNHGDVLKHLVLVAVLRYMTGKPSPLAVIDTHAGAGGYALDGTYAMRTGEARDGIGALWPRVGDATLPTPLADYLDIVGRFNPDGNLVQYPGSPAIALELLRPGDSLSLYEKHTTDERLLRGFVAQHGAAVASSRTSAQARGESAPRPSAAGARGPSPSGPRRSQPRVAVHLADGFESVARELPPRTRRGLVLIDPSYELKTDYARTLSALRECLRRFATATVIVWYPRVQLVEAMQLPRRLIASAGDAPKGWLHAALTVGHADRAGFGLSGSGVVVCNPPYLLGRQLRAVLPGLVRSLGRSPDAGFTLHEGSGSRSGLRAQS